MAALGSATGILKQFNDAAIINELSALLSPEVSTPQVDEAGAAIRREVVALNTSRSAALTGDLESEGWNNSVLLSEGA